MESKKLFADEFSFQSLWKLGRFITILQRSEIHFVKYCFVCACVVFPPMETFVLLTDVCMYLKALFS